ncbi:PH-domain-containing protein [Neocallimastix lanati (nom. inval.)]|jgi:hypothetical protein|uniref:PH-domain-containing protein n=1 Tax=Neocallimastix californiae TaxID=1754190 RepID=A0A1Y2EVW7_9FUNG|nr:PH-domain-containing protein [Neocallimastix sp. JGI-2020a]ORY75276.1 PH-domain-containing protein [Neocallimastix californiae]|eukprot:ORY75276.1 PH-domain-containing protein [Neocallimastix californiae]
MDINKLHQALDNLKIQDEKARGFQPPQVKRTINNSINPENYYPNPNNVSSKNVTYFTTTMNPNILSSDEYYNDDYYNGDSSNNSYGNSNIGTPLSTDYYYNKGSSYNSSEGSLNSLGEKKMRNVEKLRIQTNSKTNSRSHSRNQSSGSDLQFSPRNYNYDRRGSQDTMGSSIFSPTSSNCSYSQSSASVNEAMTASIKTDISSITLQTLSFDLASGWLSRITSSAGFIKNTKKYYFVLDSDGLYYFKTNDPFARAKGFIKFDTRTKIKDIKENSSAKDKNSKIIELEVYKDNKSHQVVLQAEDPEDRDMWHRAIKKMVVRQKYVNEALPPVPQSAQSGSSQPIPIPGYGSPSPDNRSRSQSQSRNLPPSQSPSLSYSQQIRLSQQKLYHENSLEALPISKKSSFQNISDINLAAPNILALQNRRRPSFDIQMLQQHHHSRTSSLSSLNDSNRHRYSYGSNQQFGSNSHMNN